MKKIIILSLLSTIVGFSQSNTTGTVALGTMMTVKIDTDPTNVTLTLSGPSNGWFGIGFGGSTMETANDMFIWNSSATRDYTSTDQIRPSEDANGSQSWTQVGTDNVEGTKRTVVYTRPLASTGDYSFLNNNSSIQVVYAIGGTTQFNARHTSRSFTTLTRTALGVEDFSLNASTIYPVPSKGSFTIQSKTGINNIGIYTHTGAFVKTVNVSPSSNTTIGVDGLSQGVYMIELANDTDKSWKKVIIE